jgi:hypothetical protein
MNCNLTNGCNGTLQINPNQSDGVKYSLTCDKCKESKIEIRTKDELVNLYVDWIAHLESGWSIEEIYNAEARNILLECKVAGADADLKYFPIAEAISEHLIEKTRGKII